ncbi:MAG: DUF1501 domain-containing protein [Planctomycetia bacterium]|nr:DUF1501 domain-containing protein [Planctomycetia bacterium]
MLNVLLNRFYRDCSGTTRREFIKIGGLGAAGLTLPALLAARARAASEGQSVKDTAVVWLWLGGGPTHVETFDPKMTAPAEYRSTTGEVATSIPGVTLGGTFPKMAKIASKMAFVRSFAHTNSGHAGGTHFVMTGYDYPPADNGEPQIKPSIGSILTRVRGSNHGATGVPTYVRLGGIYADGPSFLGPSYGPFDSGGQARNNMNLSVQRDRLDNRRELLHELDRINRDIDRTGLMDGLGKFEQQAYELVLGSATKAFDLKQEDPRLVDRYGPGLGQQMLLARRLCENGCGFVTLHYGGWDMHGTIEQSMKNISPQMDQAVSAFVDDLESRSLSQRILLVITGEFGRTPRVNGGAGRDHWAPLSTLALAGGGLKMGQVIGESDSKVEVPKTNPIGPQDMMATIFDVLGIDRQVQYVNQSGRPTYMIEHGRPIAELA